MVIGIDASRAITQERTGTEAYAYNLVKHLISLAPEQGHSLKLYFNEPPRSDLFPASAGVEQVIIPFPRLWTHLRLALELRQSSPDVFFTPAHVIPLTYRGVGVATVHDLGFRHFPETHTRRQRAYLDWSTRHNARSGRSVIADSLATKSDLIRYYNVTPSKIEVVYPAVDPELAPVKDQHRLLAARQKYGLSESYLLYLGTLQPRKNLERVIEAYLASQARSQLVLAGRPGWLAQTLLRKIERLPSDHRQRIRLLGYIDEADKAALISGATGLLYPSLHEGFGFPVLEGQVCEVPVLCADTSSFPEIAGEGALFVDPLDVMAMSKAIDRLIGDERLRQQLVDAGKLNVSRFNWETTSEKVLNVLIQAGSKY